MCVSLGVEEEGKEGGIAEIPYRVCHQGRGDVQRAEWGTLTWAVGVDVAVRWDCNDTQKERQ